MPSRKPATFISVAEYLEGERHATVSCRLESIGVTLGLDELYRNVGV